MMSRNKTTRDRDTGHSRRFATNAENCSSEDIDVGSFFRLAEAGQFNLSVRKPSRAAIKRKRQRAKLCKLLAQMKPKESTTRKRFISNFQELQTCGDDNMDFDPNLTCPVCLDLFHRPHLLDPCQHIFCEPCLRKLTKGVSTSVQCPLCRCTIQRCILDTDLHRLLCLHFSVAFTRRERMEQLLKTNRYPLPCEEPKPLKEYLLQNIARMRNNELTANVRNVRVWFVRLIAAVCGVLLSVLFMVNSLPVTMVTGYTKAQYAQSSNGWIVTFVIFCILTWFSNKVICSVFQLYITRR